MTTHQFVIEEIKNLVRTEAGSNSDQAKIDELETKIGEIGARMEDFDDLEELVDFMEKDQLISSMKKLNPIITLFRQVDNLDITTESHQLVMEELAKDPSNKLLALIRLITQAEYFEEEEMLDTDFAEFLDDIFENYSFLVELDNVFDDTIYLHGYLYNERLEHQQQIFFPVFERAVKKYPEKYILKFYLAIMLYHREIFLEALSHLYDIKNHMESTAIPEIGIKPQDGSLDFYDVLLHMAKCYDQLGKDEQGEILVTHMIENLPIVYWSDGREEEDVQDHTESFMLRMRFNLKKNNMKQVKEDYERIKDFYSFFEFDDEYPDVLKAIEDLPK